MARSFGMSDAYASTYFPADGKIPSSYYFISTGSDFKVGDILLFGPPGMPMQQLGYLDGHATFVDSISESNFPDGPLYLMTNGGWRDNDPIGNWANVVVREVMNVGGSPVTRTLDVVRNEMTSQGYSYRGYYRLLDQYKCTIAFQNSFSGGQMYVGKDVASHYLNRPELPFPAKAIPNERIPAMAISPQEVNGTKQNFQGYWTNQQGVTAFTTQEILVSVGTQNATYTAQYEGASPTGSYFYFENRTDGLPIGSIIRINGEDKVSPTPGYLSGVTATAYQYLTADRVVYAFSNWSPGDTSHTLSPMTPGTYTANYNFNYVLSAPDVFAGSGSDWEPIRLTWSPVSSLYVDSIFVYRMAKGSGPVLLARLPKTATDYTDNAFNLTPGYLDELLQYDVRLLYKTWARTVYSTPNWVFVFGTDEGTFEKRQPAKLKPSSKLPAEFEIAAYPNPFNPVTNVSFSLDKPAFVEIHVFDLQGRLVGKSSIHADAGMHQFAWDGSGFPTGTYILRATTYANDGSVNHSAYLKLLLVK